MPKQSKESHHEPCHSCRRTGAAALFLGLLTLGNGDKPAEGKSLREPLVASFGYGPAFAIVATLLCASIPLFVNTVREEPQTENV